MDTVQECPECHCEGHASCSAVQTRFVEPGLFKTKCRYRNKAREHENKEPEEDNVNNVTASKFSQCHDENDFLLLLKLTSRSFYRYGCASLRYRVILFPIDMCVDGLGGGGEGCVLFVP